MSHIFDKNTNDTRVQRESCESNTLGDIEDVGLTIHQANLEKKVSFDNKTMEFLKDLCTMIHTQSTQKDIEAAR